MENKKIKELHFGLENSDELVIPIACFRTLSINGVVDLELLKEGDTITHIYCDIKDNGKMDYVGIFGSSQISPITRLNQYNDITDVDIIYEDRTEINLRIAWYDEDNPYCNRNTNLNQTSNKSSFNEIHIDVTPYVQTYTIQEVFEFHIGGVIKDEEDNCYIIEEFEDSKCLKNQKLTQKLINMKYRIVA